MESGEVSPERERRQLSGIHVFQTPAVRYEEQLRQSIKWAGAGRRRAAMLP